MGNDSTVRTLFTIGSEISKWCDKNHIANQELADALAVSKETVKRIKAGTKKYLTSEEIRRLSVLMEKPADFFIPNDDELEDDESIKMVKRKEWKGDAFAKVKEKAQKNNNMEKTLADAMEAINEVTDIEKRETYVQQVVLIAKVAKFG